MKSPFAQQMLDSLPVPRARPLAEVFPTADQPALDLIRTCLEFNPGKRPSAQDGLRHPYVIQFHNPEDEPSCDRAIRIPIDDNTKLTVQDYRERLYNEVLKKKKEQRRSHRRNLEMQQQQQQVAYSGQSGVSSSVVHHSSSHGVRTSPTSGVAQAQYYQGSAQPQYHEQYHGQAQTYPKHNGMQAQADPRYAGSSMASYTKKK